MRRLETVNLSSIINISGHSILPKKQRNFIPQWRHVDCQTNLETSSLPSRLISKSRVAFVAGRMGSFGHKTTHERVTPKVYS
jgi:hypothetical protein